MGQPYNGSVGWVCLRIRVDRWLWTSTCKHILVQNCRKPQHSELWNVKSCKILHYLLFSCPYILVSLNNFCKNQQGEKERDWLIFLPSPFWLGCRGTVLFSVTELLTVLQILLLAFKPFLILKIHFSLHNTFHPSFVNWRRCIKRITL